MQYLFRGFHECENGTQIAVANGKEYSGDWHFLDRCEAIGTIFDKEGV